MVFFGPPRSGKSRLLDAVAAVARTRSDDTVPLVPAVEPTGPQSVVRRRVAVDLPGERVVTGDVEFIDCDGNAAQQLLADADLLRRAKARSQLAASVRSTDALVVVIDATWKPEQVDETFAQLDTFFKVLRDQRMADREVGGLPVFLVLGKADELALRGEAFADWQGRVTDELAKLEARFRDWFEDASGPFLAFGSTELRVCATATTWPDVIGGLGEHTNGFGIDELHAAVMLAAREHQSRSVRSRKRLSWTAGIAVGLLAVMLFAMVFLSSTREPPAVDALSARVKRLQQTFGPPEERLSDERFDRNRRELKAAQESPVFDLLAPDLQQFVTKELRQFAEYEGYRRRFDPPQYSPADVRTASERGEMEQSLDEALKPPAEYEGDWARTEAVRLRDKWRADLKRLADAEREVHAWYTAQIARLSELQTAAVPSEKWPPATWRAAVAEAVSRQPPHLPGEIIDGSPDVPLPRGKPITWAAAYEYERAAAVADDWGRAAVRLADVRDLADAVGLTVNPQKPDAVLNLPRPGDANTSLGLAVERLAKLRDQFPRAVERKAEWSLTSIPGPLRDVLGQRLKSAAANGTDHVRRLIAADPAAASGEWAKLAAPGGLLTRPEVLAWGELLRLLVGWAEPDRPDEDPVSALAEFVTTSEFKWEITGITLQVPNALRVNTPEKASSLTVRVGGPEKGRAFTFTAGTPRVGPGTTTVQFSPDDRDLRYIPGQEFRAEVTLTDKDESYTLRWDDARTPAFRFEAALGEPTARTVGPNPVPQRADGVKLTITTREGTRPFRVPLLLPRTK